MLVVDEVHRAASAENAKALDGDFIATLGLSATPERQFDDLFAEVIEPRVGPIIFDYDIIAATKDGILSDFEAVNVEFDLLIDEAEAYEDLTRRIARRRATTTTDDDEIIEALLRRRARISALASMRVPLAIRLCEQHKGARCLIFHEDIESAQAIYRNLIARNHAATMYHSKIAGPRRRDNLRMFRKGIFDVLVCCRALDEGLNIPEVEVAIIASSTSSVRQRIQRLGRVLRPHADKEKATIYTLFATSAEKNRLIQEAIVLKSIAEIRWANASANRG
jgi:superfamily II DNA or RNA helicase